MTSLATRRSLGVRRLLGLAAGATLVAVVSACGSSSDGVGVSDPGASPAASATTAPGTNLTITVVDGGKTSSWTLTCDPDGKGGGTHPNPDQACAALAKHAKTALPPVGPDKMCTELYGGPQTATITGSYLGEPVSSSLNRTNGCEISRWEALAGLLPKVGGTGTGTGGTGGLGSIPGGSVSPYPQATMGHGPGPQ